MSSHVKKMLYLHIREQIGIIIYRSIFVLARGKTFITFYQINLICIIINYNQLINNVWHNVFNKPEIISILNPLTQPHTHTLS